MIIIFYYDVISIIIINNWAIYSRSTGKKRKSAFRKAFGRVKDLRGENCASSYGYC